MARVLSCGYKVAKQDIQTDAADYFDYLLISPYKNDEVLFDPEEIAEFSPEEIALIKKCIETKGIIKSNERYYKQRVLGQKGDDWKGIVIFEYPEGIHEIMCAHDMFDE
jgi:hypothetical protein